MTEKFEEKKIEVTNPMFAGATTENVGCALMRWWM